MPYWPAFASTQSATFWGTPMNCVRIVSRLTSPQAAECAAADASPCAERLATKHSCAAAGPATSSTATTPPTSAPGTFRRIFMPASWLLDRPWMSLGKRIPSQSGGIRATTDGRNGSEQARRRRSTPPVLRRSRSHGAGGGRRGSAGGGDAGARRDDRLQLGVVVHTLGAELPADAGALEATERRVEVHVVLVHRVGAGADAAGDVHALVDVVGPHRPGEAVLAVVGDPHGVGGVLERDDGEHRAEDLLPGDAHVVVRVGEDRRLHVPAAVEAVGTAAAADDDTRTLLLTERDVLLDPLLLALRDERPDLGGRVRRIADLHRADHLPERVDDLRVTLLAREDAGLRDA